jgi:hypothetical protein
MPATVIACAARPSSGVASASGGRHGARAGHGGGAMVLLDHLGGSHGLPVGDVGAHLRERAAVEVDRLDPRGHRLRVQIEQETRLAVADALGERAHARGRHGHAQHPHLGERVAEGLRDDAQQHGQVRVDVGHVPGKLVELVVAHHVHVRLELEQFPDFLRADEIHLGEAREIGKRGFEQLQPLGLGELPEDHDPEAVVGLGRGRRLAHQGIAVAVGDGHEARLAKGGLEAREVVLHRARRHHHRHVGTADRLEEAAAHGDALGRQEIDERVEARIARMAFGDALVVALAADAVEVDVDRGAIRVVVVVHHQGRQPRVEQVERMPDERRGEHHLDAMLAHDLRERLLVLGMGHVGGDDLLLEAPRLEGLLGVRARMQGYAVAGRPAVGERAQNEVRALRVGAGEVPQPLGAASPEVVDHVQLDRPGAPRVLRHGSNYNSCACPNPSIS